MAYSNLLFRVVIALAFLASPMLPHGAPAHAHGPTAKFHTSHDAPGSDITSASDDHGHDHEPMVDAGDDERERFASQDRHPHPVHEDHHHGQALLDGDGTFLITVNDVRFPSYQDHSLGNGPGKLLRPPRSLSSPSEEA
ncbi:hypothetical protein [Pannonibacter phragmitetus]|uniref:hypothetical protein n=1 Tax=Pannonibacter phragmitetus TaxID=121719 RepID=UPI0013CEE998|nr:hypothetical protein [Pannonibacter phragmitetus]